MERSILLPEERFRSILSRMHLNKWLKIFLIFLFVTLSLVNGAVVYAQDGEGGKSSSRFGPKKQLSTIIFCGMGGAVLGLSTLSFYGRPQEKLSNIAIGFAIGVITGTVVATYQAAKPSSQYQEAGFMSPQQPSRLDLDYSKQDSKLLPLGKWSFHF